MLTIVLPDGSRREFEKTPVTSWDVASDIGPGLAKAAVAAEIEGKLVDLSQPLPLEGECALRLITKKDPEALEIMRHSCSHVMAEAIMRLYPEVQLAFGPTTATGFYYDIAMEKPLSEEDFPKIEKEMKKIVKERARFERLEKPREEALELCRELGQKFKVEHLETGLAEETAVSFYRQGEFIDLCRGCHIPDTRMIGKAFKLLSVAGAYWKGDAARDQLQRVYATAFFEKEELSDHLERLA